MCPGVCRCDLLQSNLKARVSFERRHRLILAGGDFKAGRCLRTRLGNAIPGGRKTKHNGAIKGLVVRVTCRLEGLFQSIQNWSDPTKSGLKVEHCFVIARLKVDRGGALRGQSMCRHCIDASRAWNDVSRTPRVPWLDRVLWEFEPLNSQTKTMRDLSKGRTSRQTWLSHGKILMVSSQLNGTWKSWTIWWGYRKGQRGATLNFHDLNTIGAWWPRREWSMKTVA